MQVLEHDYIELQLTKIIDYRRKKIPQVIVLDDNEIKEENDFVNNIEYTELLTKIEKYVCEYSSNVQQLFRLHVYGEYTFEEIAMIIDKLVSSVIDY